MQEKLRVSDNISAQVIRSRDILEDLVIKGRWKVEHWRDGKLLHTDVGENVVTNEGKKHLLDATFANATRYTTWYVALVNDNTGTAPAPAATQVYDTFFDSVALEFTSYSGGARKEFVETVASGPPPLVSNPTANRASFTFTGAGTIYGGVLVAGTAGSTFNDHGTGVLMSYRAFTPSTITVASSDVINVEIELSW